MAMQACMSSHATACFHHTWCPRKMLHEALLWIIERQYTRAFVADTRSLQVIERSSTLNEAIPVSITRRQAWQGNARLHPDLQY